MAVQLDGLERHAELVFGQDRYSEAVRAELLSMSAATIDRYLAPARASDAIRGRSTTKASPLLRSSITIRKAGDEVEAEPGFFEADTVAHCGPTLKGEFARTVNMTCVHTGWTWTRTVRNNAHTHILGALQASMTEIPFAVVGLDFVVLGTPSHPTKRAATCGNATPRRSLTFQVEQRIVRHHLPFAGSKKVCGERWRTSPGPGGAAGPFGCPA
jgi:hypothetical protein